MAREATFEGPLRLINAFNPGNSSATAQLEGFPLFWLEQTDESFGYDPDIAMKKGLADNKNIGVFAKIRHGKTSLLQIMTETFSKRNGPKGEPFKTQVDDLRRNFEHGEWYKSARLQQVKEIPLRNFQLTPFLPQFDLSRTLYTAQFMLQGGQVPPFTIERLEALRCATWAMFTDAHDHMSMPVLAYILHRLTEEDFAEFDKATLDGASQLMAATKWGARQPSVDTRDRVTAAHQMGSLVEDFIVGSLGKLFSGQESFVQHIQQPLTVIDNADLNESQMAKFQAWFWNLKSFGVANDDRQLFFDAEIHDENYKMWRYLDYATNMSDYIKQDRGHGTTLIFSTHRLRDYESVGPSNSPQYKMATNMLSDIGTWFIGRQDKRGAREIAERLDLRPNEERWLRHAERGSWLLKIGDEDPVRVRTSPTEMQRLLIESDMANQAMVKHNEN